VTSKAWRWRLLVALTLLLGCHEATLSVLSRGSAAVGGNGGGAGTEPTAGTGIMSEAGGGVGGLGGVGGAVSAAGVAGLGGESAGGAGGASVDEPGLVSHWPFDVDASDAIGNNAGTLEGGAGTAVDPVRGPVLECDGNGAYAGLSNQTPNDFSYSLWVWSEPPSGDGPLLHSNTVGEIDDFALSIQDDHLRYVSYDITTTGASNVVAGTWHHVAVTRRDGERMALYLDGELDAEGDSGSGPVLDNPLVEVCANTTSGYYYSGRVDDVRLYDRALTPDEVRDLYVATSLP
jgi:hypothetical protein